MFKIANNKKPHLCVAYHCKNEKGNKDRFCPKHRHRYNKHNRPLRYTYEALRSNAKRRGKEFNLSFEEFKKFCEENNYMKLKGRKANSASIDRINPNIGYEYSNLQILSLSENSSKMHEDNKTQNEQEDLPF